MFFFFAFVAFKIFFFTVQHVRRTFKFSQTITNNKMWKNRVNGFHYACSNLFVRFICTWIPCNIKIKTHGLDIKNIVYNENVIEEFFFILCVPLTACVLASDSLQKNEKLYETTGRICVLFFCILMLFSLLYVLSLCSSENNVVLEWHQNEIYSVSTLDRSVSLSLNKSIYFFIF